VGEALTARDEILARIRAIDRSPGLPVPRGYRRRGTLDEDGRVRLLAERIAEYRAEVREVDDVRAAIAAVCEEQAVARLGVPAGLPVEWRPRTAEIVEDHGLAPRELEALDGVATGCTVAVAETGTIVLAAGPAEGRRALTLVPDLHVCVIRREQVVELVPEAIARLDPRRPLTFVSGPSATSDIELSRVEGVHGPRTLVALILEEDDP
jgi:L-lactate dehydrogenase complex protein LldG